MLGVFPDWQTIDRYIECEAASVRRRDEAGPGATPQRAALGPVDGPSPRRSAEKPHVTKTK
jgi:hypothetical protein